MPPTHRLRATAPTCLLLIAMSLPAANAAPITWGTPFNITSDAHIDTSGTLVHAKNATRDGVSPVVDVGGETITFDAMQFGVSITSTGTFYTGGGGDTGNADLNAVLNSHTWSGNPWSFELTGLTPGTDYQVQVIGAGDSRGCCSGRNQRAGDGENPENISGDFSRSGVGSVIGTFTAGGSTQTVRILKGINNDQDPGISGYILRTAAPPTPQPPTDIALSNTDLAPATTAGTLVGTLTTSDPNPGDTHTYSFVDTASFPDNSRFTIANGNELRAASNLGSFGSSYTVRLRTTDNEALSYDETLTLDVEAAQPPTALNFSATTILRTSSTGSLAGTFSTVDPNAADAHTYTLVPGTGSTDNATFTIDGNQLKVAGPLPGLGAVLSVRVRTTDLSALSVEAAFTLTVVDTSVRINEFLANNTPDTLTDEDGDTSDWIELHNPDGGTVALGGWYLTDDPANLTKWQLPDVSISPDGYLVVFASSKNRRPTNGDNLHTNFALSSGGEYVALVAADGSTVISEFGPSGTGFPSQKPATTYGFYGDPLQIGFMLNPTPGAANDAGSGVLGFVADTKFSTDRGFYDTPFQLSITTSTPGATIRYTTDGSWPSETSGNIYTAPIDVDRTTPIKALAYKQDFLSTNIDTHTYILVDSVVQQTNTNTMSTYGLPDFSNKYYGMDNNPSVNPLTHPTIKDDLKTVPSLSIAIDADDMFHSSTGIYTHPTSSGTAWERKTSLELIDPADPLGGGNFQQNCAIRIQGGAFRSFGLTRKKSFRVLFKSQYGTGNLPTGGAGTLNFPLFGKEPGVTDEFQTLVFRMESNDGWQWSGANGQPQYARDQFGRRAQLALGQPASHGRYLHLYINGVYWGLYNVVERPDASFAETYIDGVDDRDLWEGQNSGNPINSATNINTWNSYKSVLAPITTAANDDARDQIYLQACGFNTDGTRNPAHPVWCDPDNTIDYFLVNWYAGNSDWPRKNYYGGIDTQTATRTGYKYFMWDAEWSLFLRSNTTTNRLEDFRGIAEPNDDLEESPEYQIRFADRAHRALFNDGPLSPSGARALYEEVTAQHTSILVPEAARWGNQHNQARDVGDWQNEYNRIISDWFPVRTANFLGQLRARDLYPDIDAPTYSQHGGSVPSGSGPALSVPGSVTKIYYRFGAGDDDPTDYGHSLDPRLVGGAINGAATLIDFGAPGGGTNTSAPLSLTQPGWLFSRSYSSATGEWSALNTAFFSIDAVPADSTNLVVSEFNYHPAEPTLPAETAISTNRDDFEFMELMNVGPQPVDLTGVTISGITFAFAENTLLDAGQRLVIVRDHAAFETRYAAKLGSITYGLNTAGTPEYAGGLSNGGEQIVISGPGGVIRDFTYLDDLPWPPTADGFGPSLVLIDPSVPVPDHNDATSWAASSELDGSPGTANTFGFSGTPTDNLDGDDYSALLEYALGTNDSNPGDDGKIVASHAPFTVGMITSDYLTISFQKNLNAHNLITYDVEVSTDLTAWSGGASAVFVSEFDNGDGTSTVTYRSAAPVSSGSRHFIRLGVTQ